MCNICDCTNIAKSLGLVGCPALFDVAYKFVLTLYRKADGTVNEINLSADPTLNAAYFNALVAQSDQPWIPTPEVLNYDTEREDAKVETFNNDTVSVFVAQGRRTVKGVWIQVPANIADILQSYNCSEFGFYVITKAGELVGMEGSGWKKLAPIKIEKGSFKSKLMPKTNVAINVQKAMVEFAYDEGECDGNLKMIAASDIAAGYSLKQLAGLIQVQFKQVSAGSSTTLVIAADTNQGSIVSPSLVTGLVAGDFVLTNMTTGLAVAKTLAESAARVYTLTFLAQTTGDELKLTCSKTGYSFTIYSSNFL